MLFVQKMILDLKIMMHKDLLHPSVLRQSKKVDKLILKMINR